MADEPTTPTIEQAASAASPPPAAPGDGNSSPAPAAPEQPSIGDLLNWNAEERGEMPAEHRELLTPEAIREWHTSETERVRTEAAQAAEARAAADSADRQLRERQAGEIQQDVDFYNDLKARLYSTDTEVAAKALADFKADGAEARYNRGAVAAQRLTVETQQREVLTGLFGAMHNELEQAGLKGLLPAPGSPEWRQFAVDLAQYDGKGGFAAYLIDKGKSAGIEEGRRLATEEFERNGRIEAGKGGGPEGGSPTPSGGRYGDRAWVNQQIAADPQWRLKPSGQKDTNGRDLTNNDLVLSAMAGRR